MESPKFTASVKNNADITPLQLAIQKGDDEFVHFIKNFVSGQHLDKGARSTISVS